MAQDFGELLTGTKKDANYLVKGYVSPALKVLGAGLNQGWYNTAKPHKIFGVDLTISVAAIKVPSADELFTVDNSRLSQVGLVTNHTGGSVDINSGSGKIPTIFGSSSTKGRFDYKSGPSAPFDAPDGVGLKDLPMGRLPIPVVNLAFGLPKNTDLKFRYVPTLGSDDAKFSLFGIGVMHDVKQWIPGIKLLPFDLSGFVGFTRMSLKAELEDDADKKGNFSINATTIQGLISKKLSVLTVYGGVGYNFVKSKLQVKGTYDLDGVQVKDPIDITLASSGPRLTTGMRLKLAVFTFHGDYTFQKYSAFTAGFGINVR
jgi:hypothetical protein